MAAVMPGGSACFSCPLGPLTSTPLASALTVTPLGIAIGFFPIRDMASLPNVANDCAADAGFFRRLPRHHAARGRQNRHAQPAEHGRHFVAARIDAAAGTADALEARNRLLAAGTVLQEHAHLLPRGFARAGCGRLHHLEPCDVTLVLQDPGDLGLQLRGRHLDARVARRDGVPDPGQHVGYRVCHLFVLPWNLGTVRTVRTRFSCYQLLFVTPATSPVRASSRKHKRHKANLRIYARGRPHRRQRLRCRTANFKVLRSRAFFAVVAISRLCALWWLNSCGTACPGTAAASAPLRPSSPSSPR